VATSLIQDILFQRLVDQGKEDEAFALYVLAACEGEEALAQFLRGARVQGRPEARHAAADVSPVPPTYITGIHVRSFRGIGGEAALGLTPGPGVTLVVGRNGSGKSSFAEGAEVAFTGTSARWKDRGSTEWLKGWRNVHSALAPRLLVELLQQGIPGVSKLERTWTDPTDVGATRAHVIDPERKSQPLTSSNWASALELHRPFLTYSELGGMLSGGPTKVYQAVIAGLGLEEHLRVRDGLSAACSVQKGAWEASRKHAVSLGERAKALAAAHPDELRFVRLAELLGKRNRDVAAIAALVTSSHLDAAGQSLDAVVRLTSPLSSTALADMAASLREAFERQQMLRAESAGLMLGLSRLLRDALAVADAAPQERCPVCESPVPLDAAWRTRTTSRLAEVDMAAEAARAAEQQVADLLRQAQALCTPAPAALLGDAAAALAPAAAAREAWAAWSEGQRVSTADAMAAHLERAGGPLAEALDTLVTEARAEAARRDTVWQPFAVEVAQWVADAPAALQAREHERLLSEAKEWVSGAIETERQARFAPVKARAIAFWNLIAQQSNVALQDIELTGHGPTTKVALKVTVDGKEAPALGVLSQGELNAMTLSLFLPRVLLPSTPFGFVIVDDPVQAMDEVRVEGLAQVLAEVGQTRQVIVFTHDARLPEAFERLALPHGKRRVNRAAESSVVVSPLVGPWEQRLKDASDVTQTPDLPETIAGRVVPAFCRMALEAACTEALRRQWLLRGEDHADVEKRLKSRGLRELLALLFAGDARQHAGNEARLRKLKTKDAAAIVLDCQRGAHEGFAGSPSVMVERCKALCEELRKVTAA
jgi:recombinational DNA repair ATPase RecF